MIFLSFLCSVLEEIEIFNSVFLKTYRYTRDSLEHVLMFVTL